MTAKMALQVHITEKMALMLAQLKLAVMEVKLS